MGFWKAILSIDESKHSVCIYVFIVSTIYALISVYTKGDIPPNLLTFEGYLLAAIFGINVANSIGSSYMNRPMNMTTNTYSPYGMNTTNQYGQYPMQGNMNPMSPMGNVQSPVQNQVNPTQNTSKPTI